MLVVRTEASASQVTNKSKSQKTKLIAYLTEQLALGTEASASQVTSKTRNKIQSPCPKSPANVPNGFPMGSYPNGFPQCSYPNPLGHGNPSDACMAESNTGSQNIGSQNWVLI